MSGATGAAAAAGARRAAWLGRRGAGPRHRHCAGARRSGYWRYSGRRAAVTVALLGAATQPAGGRFSLGHHASNIEINQN